MQPVVEISGIERSSEDIAFRGNYFADGLYARTDIVRGVTRNRLGTRLCALSADFLRGLRRAIEDECGPAADVVFRTCGRKWGMLLARRFEKELADFYGQPLREFTVATFLACLTEMFSQHGWGQLRLDLSYYDQGLLVAELRGAIMADLFPGSDRPVDTLFAGIFAGFFSQLSGEDLDCVQTECTACGADASRFVIGLSQRLTQVETWRANGQSHAQIVAALANVRGGKETSP
ncbi:MAG: hypothetical protein NZ700_17120 [Gemmataceae bacterium]|nr:hypothetical protein [Gemmataceae bacterium]MDW8264123.1 V4R domain-containing protein [Gemmataceae bacterium]